MKLISITTDPEAGGSSKSLVNLLVGLKKYGIDIIVALPRRGYLSKKLDEVNIEYRLTPFLGLMVWPRFKTMSDKILFIPRVLKTLIYNYLATKKIGKLAILEKPDLIHTNVSLCTSGWRVAQKLGIKHIWHIREYGYLDFELHSIPSDKTKNNSLKDSLTIAITNGIKNYYNLGDKCRVIYNGIKSIYDCKYNENKSNYFLYVGHVNEYKGVSELIKAYISYIEKGGMLKLKILGRYDESYRKILVSELKHSHVEDFVEFLGQRDDVDDYMSVAKALIVPSIYEAFGRVTAEAMFNGCLIIGRNTGGTKEQFDLGKEFTGNPIGLRFNDINELVQQMQNVEKMDEAYCKQMVLSSQKLAKEKFSIEQNIKNSYEFFIQAISC